MKRFEKTKSNPAIPIAIWLSLPVVFVADAFMPLGMVGWIFYLVPLVLCLYEWRPRLPLLVAAVSTLSILATFFLNTRVPDFPVWNIPINL